jgi:pimeloyl-ACP methyl ester carboxylesterase
MPISMQVLTIPGGMNTATDVVYRPPNGGSSNRLTCFFPGDLSEFWYPGANQGSAYADYKFSIEAVSWVVSSKIPDSFSLTVIKPFRVTDSYALYENFFPCDQHGTPDFTKTYATDAFLRVLRRISNAPTDTACSTKIELIGFSRGCAVVLALLKERNPAILGLAERVILIDPGSHIRNTTFPFTDRDYASFPASIPVYVFSSPYQYDDPRRPWLRHEINEFVSKSMCSFDFLQNVDNSLEGHFDSISCALDRLYA